MARPSLVLSSTEILGRINEGLKKQAVRPNLYAYVPHEKQYIFHKSKKKVILYTGGNRSGKTVGGGVETVYRLLGKNPYKSVPPAPVRGRIVTTDFNSGLPQIILPVLQQYLPPSALIKGSWEESYDKNERVLTLANKSMVEIKSHEQDLEKFAGTSRHFVWYDEEPPKHIFDESQARLVDTNGDAYLTLTPLDGMTWVYHEIYEPGLSGLRDDVEVIEIDMFDNPHIDKEAAERYLRTLDPEERKARKSGQFISVGGKVFKSFQESVHVIEPFIPPLNWEWYVSFDHGYNNPTAIYWHAVSPEGYIVTFSEHYKSEMVIKDHADVYHTRNAALGKVPNLTVGDPAMAQRLSNTGMSVITEYGQHGVYIAPANNNVDVGVTKMAEYLKINPLTNKPTWQITANCVNLINELKKLRWASYVSKKIAYDSNKKETIHKKDDHAFDSCRYLFSFLPTLAPIAEVPTTNRSKLDAVLSPTTAFKTWDEALATPKGQYPVSSALEKQDKIWIIEEGFDLMLD